MSVCHHDSIKEIIIILEIPICLFCRFQHTARVSKWMHKNCFANKTKPSIVITDLDTTVLKNINQRVVMNLCMKLLVVMVKAINKNKLQRCLWHQFKQVGVQILSKIILEA